MGSSDINNAAETSVTSVAPPAAGAEKAGSGAQGPCPKVEQKKTTVDLDTIARPKPSIPHPAGILEIFLETLHNESSCCQPTTRCPGIIYAITNDNRY